jgi:uncharacterized membrane protein
MIDWLTSAFSLVCGRHAEHMWAPGGLALPCCQRCTGLYVGALCAVILQLLLRPRASARFLWVHAVFLLQMAPFGFHWVPQGPILRTLSGTLFAFGIVACLWLLPGARWSPSGGNRHCHPWEYALALVGSAMLPLVLALWGGPPCAGALALLAGLGAMALSVLAVLNLALLPGAFGARFQGARLGLVL